MDAGGYIFNTEAHPIDPGALHCCRRVQSVFPEKKSTLRKFVSVENHSEEESSESFSDEERIMQNESERDKSIAIVKLSEMRQTANLTKENISKVEENEAIVENEEMEIETENVSSENSRIQVVPPPNVIYKADDSENIESYEIGRATVEFSSTVSLNNQSDKLEEQVPKKKFEPQAMLENIRRGNLYPMNLTAKIDYQTLSCKAQPFLQRISIVGEFFWKTAN